MVAKPGRRLADVKGHDRGLEGTRAADSPALCGSPAGGVAGGKRIFARLALSPRRSGTGRAAGEGTVDDLAGYTRNIDVQVFEGNKVIDIRNSGVNKGTAGVEWLQQHNPDFILGIGDDWTDEDLFRALPASAYSVRVGVASTAARYYLSGPATVRKLLRELSESPRDKTSGAVPAN